MAVLISDSVFSRGKEHGLHDVILSHTAQHSACMKCASECCMAPAHFAIYADMYSHVYHIAA
jgi:hypothetical protein